MKLYLHKLSGKLALGILLLAQWPALSSSTAVVQEKWIRLGSRTVTATIDHTELTFDGLQHGLNGVKVKVTSGAINLHRCVAYYKDSQTEEVAVLNAIPQGSESKVIELTRTGQPVVKLVFVYDTKNRAIQKADVEVWGRQHN